MFVGGAFEKASLFSLGIMPYISASIIIQLMGSVLPYFQRLQKEGEAGRKKITQITRYGTVLIATMQSYGVTVFLEKELQVVVNPGPLFVFTAIISMVTGTILLMWMGERITERGIGNGISLIIMVGIISRLPFVIGNEIRAVLAGEKLFIRVERQTIRRMPKTKAIIFTVRVHVSPLHSIKDDLLKLNDLLLAIKNLDILMRIIMIEL